MARFRARVTAGAGLAVVMAAGLVGFAPPAAATESYPAPASGVWAVVGHGFGHGHGLSQYGARGAARAGLTAAQIVAFYYPGTTLVTRDNRVIRVRISNSGSYTTVVAALGMQVTGVTGDLPTTGVSYFRLVPSGTGLQLQRYVASGWAAYKDGLPAQADFRTTAGYVRLVHADGSRTDYRGTIGAVRDGAGLFTVNRVPLEDYTAGAQPREMPSSWEAAAVQSQAIAARTYARNAMESHAAQKYDICDTTNCQVYGGMRHYSSGGSLLWSEDRTATVATANKILAYPGATGGAAFTQYSASNGGWTDDGGQPYLVAKADPYAANADDPYFTWTRSARVSDVAAYYGLARITGLDITGRDGNGEWGGRVTAAVVHGVTSSGSGVSRQVSGFSIADALGLPHHWFKISAVPPAAPASASASSRDAAALVSWTPPAQTGNSPVNAYSVTVPGVQRVQVGAAARQAWIGGLVNGRTYRGEVRARNDGGWGPPAYVSIAPAAAPKPARPVTPLRLLDTRSLAARVTATAPLRYGVPGHGSIPTGATGATLAVTVVNPTQSGVLRVYTHGAPAGSTAAVAYRAGTVTTATVSVPFVTSSTVVMAPTAGSMDLILDQVSYTAATGSAVGVVGPALIADTSVLGTGSGRTLRVRGVGGVPADASAVVLAVSARSTGATGYIRAWADGSAAPLVSQVTVEPGSRGVNTFVVPIGGNGAVRLAASTAAIGAQVSIVGYLAPAAAGRGLLESVPATGVHDAAAGVGPDLDIGTSAVPVAIAGRTQVPASGVQAALLQVTARSSAAGVIYVYPAGAASPRQPAAWFPATGSVTVTVLARLGANGAVTMRTNGPAATVSVDVIGYVTT